MCGESILRILPPGRDDRCLEEGRVDSCVEPINIISFHGRVGGNEGTTPEFHHLPRIGNAGLLNAS